MNSNLAAAIYGKSAGKAQRPALLASLTSIAFLAGMAVQPAVAVNKYDEEHKMHQAKFDQYAKKVDELSKNAGPEYQAVMAVTRIPAGSTIDKSWVQMVPRIDYSKTVGDYPDPSLKKRPADQVGTLDQVVGHVALQEIQEREEIKKAQVGGLPQEQFKVEQNTPVQVHYRFRRGAVRFGAPAEVHECTLDTDGMKASEAADFRKRVIDSKVLTDPDFKYEMLAGGYENYVLEVKVGKVTRKIDWSGRRAPGDVWPLVDFLESHSKKTNFPGSQ